MANNAIINKYPVDLSAVNSTNLVTRESHQLVNHEGTAHRVLVPTYGGFYTQGLDVRNDSYVSLTPNVDYIATYLYEDATSRTGFEVCGAIVIINPLVSEQVYFTAQIVGGDYAYSTKALSSTVLSLQGHASNWIPLWAGLIGVPTQFPPGGFDQELWQQQGFQPFVLELERLNRAITLGDLDTLKETEALVRDLDAEFRALLKLSTDKLAAHVADMLDPHALTRIQMGLEFVDNLPLSVAGEGITADKHDSYLTPAVGLEAINTHALPLLAQHTDGVYSSANMPHGETRDQLGLLSTSEIQALLLDYLNKTGPGSKAVDSRGFMAVGYSTFIDRTRSFDATDFTNGQVSTDHLGPGYTDGTYVLANGGTWTSIAELFKQYQTINPSTYFVGYRGNDTNAFAHIELTFADITAYPLGTIVLWVSEISGIASRGNDAVAYSFKLMRVAQRTTGGWRQLTPNPIATYY